MPARFALSLFLVVAGVGSAAGQGPPATAGVDFPLQVPTQGPSCVLPPDGRGQRPAKVPSERPARQTGSTVGRLLPDCSRDEPRPTGTASADAAPWASWVVRP